MSAQRWRAEVAGLLNTLWPWLPDGWAWIEAQIQQESGGDPEARSPVGAVGLLQLMPDTARDMGLIVTPTRDDRLIPDRNLWAGIRYLRIQYSRFPEIPAHFDRLYWSLAAYNGGRGYCNVALAQARQEGIAPDWDECSKYLRSTVLRGRRPDWRQMLDYVTKIRTAAECLIREARP